MKKILILLSVCIAGILLASCQKESTQDTFKFDGKDVKVVAAISMNMDGEVGIDFDLEDGTHGFLKNLQSCVGTTVQLGKEVSGKEYSIGCNGTPQLYTMLEKGKLLYNDFKSGKMVIKKAKDGYLLTIDAVLLDGRKLYIHLKAVDEAVFNSRVK
ncbi:MAG: hypothetical protein J5769_02065 [Bacteroidales bacterium]|nr:hypothetical protein [Bacteroidales bacterium]